MITVVMIISQINGKVVCNVEMIDNENACDCNDRWW